MKDIEKLIQYVIKKALVEFTRETKCGLIDIHEGRLLHDIDGKTYEIIVREVTDA